VTSPAATELRVEFGFGFGPGDTLDDDDWVDVTPWIDADEGSVVVEATSGRDRPDSGITVGTATVRLENLDGRFDPRNTAGPHFGQLNIGTPVRIRIGYGAAVYGAAVYGAAVYGAGGDSIVETCWSGFVAGGFPQTFTDTMQTVTVECHDLFGVLDAADAPASALAAFVAGLGEQPDHYWQPSAGGWIDRGGGVLARHTGGLVEFDPIVNGDERSFGQTDPDGWGTVDDPAGHLNASSQSITLITRFRFPKVAQRRASTDPAVVPRITVVEQNEPDGLRPFRLEVIDGEILFTVHTATHRRTGSTVIDTSMFDDRAHTLCVHAPAGSGALRCWVDGVEVALTQVSLALAGTIDAGPLYFGVQDPWNPNVYPYQGVIDPIIVWRGYGGDLGALAAGVHAAAWRGWADQRLDERATNLVTAAGLAAHIGAFDTSGVVTLQSYRPRAPLELLQTVEDTEQGRIWIDRLGRIRFSRRDWAWNDEPATTVQATITDDPDLLASGDAIEFGEGSVIEDSPFDLVNVAQVNSEFGRQQTATDPASIAATGRRNAVQLSNLLHPTDRQSLAIAQWIILSQSQGPVRAREVSFRVESDPGVCAPVAQLVEPGWLVRVVKHPPIGCDGDPIGDPIDVLAHVAGVRRQWSHLGLTVTLTLDSTRAGRSWFRWDLDDWESAPWAF
jgi:hypothetical protein